MPDDPWSKLARARRDYLAAVLARDRLEPGDPCYRQAVHRVGVAWTAIKHWERVLSRGRRGGT